MHNAEAFPTIGIFEPQVCGMIHKGSSPPNSDPFSQESLKGLKSNKNKYLERRSSRSSGDHITQNHRKSPLLHTYVVLGGSLRVAYYGVF